MMQSVSSRRGSVISSHMHYRHALVCRHLHPTCFTGKSSILGGNVKSFLSQSRHLTAYKQHKDEINRRRRWGNYSAALADDAPFALAIGASILSTLVLPIAQEQEENKESSLFGPDDVRSGAMQIISFIPLFNWLVWVFAWLDTRQPRYLAFSAIYLAPYLKTGLSVSPEESWLPIASILACIVHVQLDISVSNEGTQPLRGISKVLLEKTQIKDFSIRAEGLVARLKELAKKSDSQPLNKYIQEDNDTEGEEWKAIQAELLKKEFAEWDAKLSEPKAGEEPTKELDS